MTTVGIIANPAAGKDIRRLVAHGRFVPNQEKVNILKRIMAGLDAVGVERVVMMPDMGMLGKGALDGTHFDLEVEFLDMIVFNEERDSTRAAEMMAQMGIGCLITLGGDGTNRAVAKGSGNIPLVPVSTGTNNVFPRLIEGTLAGLSAGVVACKLVDVEKVTKVSKRLEVYINDEFRDIALVDVAISKERFVGARAVWDMATVHELILCRAEPASIGLSAVGARLQPVSIDDKLGLYIRIGSGGCTVIAPIAPGMIIPIEIAEWHPIEIIEQVEIDLRPCTIALDGERSFSVQQGQSAYIRLSDKGPLVVSIEDSLQEAALNGVFFRED